MILQCSECQYRYLVPDQAIGAAGRTVRCAHCQHTWFQQLPEEAFEKAALEALGDLDQMVSAINTRAEPQADIQPKPLAPGSNLPAIRRKLRIPASLGTKVATISMGAIAAALIILLVHPKLLGFRPSTDLVLADPGMVKLTLENHAVYNINGKILNTSKVSRTAPTVMVTLMDDDGVAVQKPWKIRFNGQAIEPGKAVSFTTGNMEMPANSKATRFVVDIGNALELTLRRKPE